MPGNRAATSAGFCWPRAAAHLGRAEEARAEWQEALRINPDCSIEHRRQILPYKNPTDFERVVEGLRKGGIAV